MIVDVGREFAWNHCRKKRMRMQKLMLSRTTGNDLKMNEDGQLESEAPGGSVTIEY